MKCVICKHGETTDAEGKVTVTLEHLPKNQELHMRLGNTYLEIKEYKKASQEFEKLIKINPSMSKELAHLKPYFNSHGINFNLNP